MLKWKVYVQVEKGAVNWLHRRRMWDVAVDRNSAYGKVREPRGM